MKRDKTYGPGTYTVEVTLRGSYVVMDGEDATESDMLDDCRKFGETVDWEVEEQ